MCNFNMFCPKMLLIFIRIANCPATKRCGTIFYPPAANDPELDPNKIPKMEETRISVTTVCHLSKNAGLNLLSISSGNREIISWVPLIKNLNRSKYRMTLNFTITDSMNKNMINTISCISLFTFSIKLSIISLRLFWFKAWPY